jgi:Fibronectin type III-like domain
VPSSRLLGLRTALALPRSQRLVAFQKVFVEPEELMPVTITIDPTATNHPFGVWDYCTRAFVTKPGRMHRLRWQLG